MILTIKLRLRDNLNSEMKRQTRAVNFVWNYCNETQRKAVLSGRKWLTWIDLQHLTAGSSKELHIHAHTIQRVCQQYDKSRANKRRPWLRFRGRKALGWIPFNQGNVTVVEPGKLKFRGVIYEAMHWRTLPDGVVIRAGSFNQDSRGHWYINMPVEFPTETFPKSKSGLVGLDLGLKDLAVLSDGEKIAAPRHYRRLEQKLAAAQRARKKRLVRSIAARIGNQRKDHLHKASARIALAHDIIVVGDVSSSKLARTNMAKSVLDAGWSTFRKQLSYKAMRHGGRYIEVNEAYTTQTCSACGSIPQGRPEGIADLEIRQWTCGGCGAVLDRDVNAARNIARLGWETLEEGVPHYSGEPSKRPVSCEETGRIHPMQWKF